MWSLFRTCFYFFIIVRGTWFWIKSIINIVVIWLIFNDFFKMRCNTSNFGPFFYGWRWRNKLFVIAALRIFFSTWPGTHKGNIWSNSIRIESFFPPCTSYMCFFSFPHGNLQCYKNITHEINSRIAYMANHHKQSPAMTFYHFHILKSQLFLKYFW